MRRSVTNSTFVAAPTPANPSNPISLGFLNPQNPTATVNNPRTSLTMALPPGLVFDAVNRRITGTITGLLPLNTPVRITKTRFGATPALNVVDTEDLPLFTVAPWLAFSQTEEANVINALIQDRQVGDVVSINLNGILAPQSATALASTVTITGLPPGLTFNATTRLITGTITGELGDAVVKITKTLSGAGSPTRTIELPGFTVKPFQLAGGYEVLIRDAANPTLPVGRVLLTITGPRAFSATLSRLGQASRTSSAPAVVAPANLTSPVRVRFAGSGTGATAVKPTWVTFNLPTLGTSDLVTGTVQDVIQLSTVAAQQTYANETAANATTVGSSKGSVSSRLAGLRR